LTDKARARGTGNNRESREGNREQGSRRYKINEGEVQRWKDKIGI